jgi:hypothetical protein
MADIGTLTGTIAISDRFTSVLDRLSERVNTAVNALDSMAAKSSTAGSRIGSSFAEAGRQSSIFGNLFSSSTQRASEAMDEGKKNAEETKLSFTEMFEHPLDTMKHFASEMETIVLGSLGREGATDAI